MRPGTTIGAYEVASRLGAGGMGEVYRAHDTRLQRDVALKLLPAGLAREPAQRSQLLAEARAAASLNHPHICTIHEVGEADGHTYIAMELIDGASLSDRLSHGSFSPAEALRYGIQLADALAHAHDRGIIHRDLKSANVMIASEGRLKVLDFGLAKRLTRAEVDAATHTATSLNEPGTITGTLPYMAPEQLRAQPADARTDVWALGVVLYELATGARPFTGDTTFELSAGILNSGPTPLPPAIPAPLQAIINRCLEKDPARRYQRASEVRAALEAAATGTLATAVANRTTPRRWPVGAAALVVAGVLIAAAWVNRASIREAVAGGAATGAIQSLAVLPFEDLSREPEQEYLAAGLHEGLTTDVARIGLQKVIAKGSTSAFKGTTKSSREIGQELGVEGLVTGSILRAGDRLQVTAQLVRADTGEVLWANRYDRRATDVASVESDIAGDLTRQLRPASAPTGTGRAPVARAVNPAAYDAYLKGRFLFTHSSSLPEPPRQLDAAIAQYERATEIDPAYAPPYAALTMAHWAVNANSFRAPKDTFPKARAAALKAVALDDTLAEAHAAAAIVALWFDWNWAAVQNEVQRALQLNPDSVDALTSQESFLVLVAGRAAEASAVSRRILTLDPLNPFSRMQAAWVAHFTGRFDDSIREVNSILEVAPDHIWAHFFQASNYAAKKMRAEVLAECSRVRALLGNSYAMQPFGMCAWALAAVGEDKEARRLLTILEHPPAGVWLDPCVMGPIYGALGDRDRAIEWLQKGLDERAPNMVYLKVGPAWDAMRDDPRFKAILGQMNFP